MHVAFGDGTNLVSDADFKFDNDRTTKTAIITGSLTASAEISGSNIRAGFYHGDGSNLIKTQRYIQFRLLGSGTNHTVDTSIGGDLRFPVAMTLQNVGAYCDTAGSTGGATIDKIRLLLPDL